MSIDKSIRELIATATASGESLVSVENVTLARMRLDDLIAAAIADARREGAEAMQEASIAAVKSNWMREAITEAIRALPLPTGPRQAVRLKMADVEKIALKNEFWSTVSGGHQQFAWGLFAHAIETAVLAANGMGEGNG